MKHLIAGIALLFASVAYAEVPMLPENVIFIGSGDCSDLWTGEYGTCNLFDDDGDTWLVFTQDDEITFIRWLPADEEDAINVYEKDGWGVY